MGTAVCEATAGLDDPAPENVVDLATVGLPAHHELRVLAATLGEHVARVDFDAPVAPAAGLPSLRAAVAARLTGQGLATIPEQVMITAGEPHAFSLVAGTVFRRRGHALVENPTSPWILTALRPFPATLCGARPVTAGQDHLMRMVERRNPRLIHLMPTLGPRGQVLGDHLRSRLAWAVGDRDTVVIDDVTQASLTFEPAPPPLAAYGDAPNLVTVGSLGAVHWGGLSVGWLRATPALVDHLTRSTTHWRVPVLDQLLAERLLPIDEQLRRRRIGWLRECLDHATATLSAQLPDFGWQPPAGGLTIWLKPPAGARPGFAESLAPYGVAVLPGALFAPRRPSNHFGLVYARDAALVEEGVRRIAAAWRDQCRT